MRENAIKKIIAYFEKNEDTFNDCIKELDSYNGYLNDDRYYLMKDLDDFYRDSDPLEILRLAYYGHDADSYHTDSYGRREYAEFNPNREYYTYNGYGNLISTDYPDYTDYINEYTIEEMSENRSYINSIESDDELAALFDELEAEETED